MEFDNIQKSREIWDSIPQSNSAKSADAFARFSSSAGPFSNRRPKFRNIAAISLSGITAFAVAVCLTVLFTPRASAPQWKEFAVGTTLRDSVRLPDNTVVWLNSDSRLIYPDSFEDADERKVFLYGEAYFSVTSDAEHPFIVCSGDVRAKVYGTEFNMTTYDNLDYVSVALVSGKMNVTLEGTGKCENLLPGDVVRFDKDKGILSKEASRSMSECMWKDGGYFFHDQKLQEIVAQLERNFACRIVVAEPDAAVKRLSIAFVNDESLEQMLNAIASNCGTVCSKKFDTYYITK